MKNNHEKYLKLQSQKLSRQMGKETCESRRKRLEMQGGPRATCGSVIGDKRRKKLDRAMMLCLD